MREDRLSGVRARHRLEEVAARTGILVPASAGPAVTVRCPFPSHGHPDRTPSLRLYLADDRYYCFGCAARGDVLQWVRDAEGVGLLAAIEVLDTGAAIRNAWAGRSGDGAGHRPPGAPRAPGTPDRPELPRTTEERVQEALDEALAYYGAAPRHARAVSYLAGRGIEVSVLERHTGRVEVGHTPAERDGLASSLRRRGFSDDELVDAGLALRRGGATLDFYRGRVLVALRDGDGRLAGFVGRNVSAAPAPKYTNPPRTQRYDKSRTLYRPLPPPSEPSGRVVVVEGTLDAMAIAVAAIRAGRHGLFCPVTQSGRELSPVQLELVLRLHPNPPVVVFDADAAGRESTERLVAAASAAGVQATVADLPDREDPASWLVSQGEAGLDRFLGAGAAVARGAGTGGGDRERRVALARRVPAARRYARRGPAPAPPGAARALDRQAAAVACRPWDAPERDAGPAL